MAQAKGSLGQLLTQMESAFKVAPVTVKTRKCYFTDETLTKQQGMGQSRIISGASRHPTEGYLDNVQVSGAINSELMSDTFFWGAALGSLECSESGGTLGADITPTAGTINATLQTFTLTKTAHGLTVGDSIKIESLTAPTSLNNLVCPVINIPTADTFVLWIPMGTTTTYTKGSGTFKKVTAAGINTYTFKAGGYLPSYIIEKGFPDIAQYFKFTGCMCGGLEMNHPTAGVVTLNSQWMGGALAESGTSYETGTAVDNGKACFDAFKLAAADMKEGGSAIAKVRSLSMRFDNVLDGDTYVLGGGGDRAAINAGIYQITGDAAFVFDDLVLYNKAKNSTESSLDLTYKRGTGAGSAGNESVQIVIPALKFSLDSPKIEGSKGVELRLTYTGYYKSADLTALKVVVKSPVLPGAMI